MICPDCGHRLTARRSLLVGMGARCERRERLNPPLFDYSEIGPPDRGRAEVILTRARDGSLVARAGGGSK